MAHIKEKKGKQQTFIARIVQIRCKRLVIFGLLNDFDRQIFINDF